jgi:hypothetical protein
MSGDEVPHAPHLALTAEPWPGPVALYDAAQDEDYALSDVFAARSVIGVTESDLDAARPGVIDRGAPLSVRLVNGALQSITDAGLLTGGNLMAIGDGATGNWELFQFRDTSLVSEGRWLLSHRLRGQAGTDGVMPSSWPAGSTVVLIDGAQRQIGLKGLHRGLERHYRVGSASRPYDHGSYAHRVLAFEGNGLRPYRPAHLRSSFDLAGDVTVSWRRRTRIDGDGWDVTDVPLGEDSEAYRVQVRDGNDVVRDVTVAEPEWLYSVADRYADGISGGYRIAVAQVSQRYGHGPWAELDLSV